jgi:hypothetical protein
VAAGVGPEFKAQHHKKEKKRKNKDLAPVLCPNSKPAFFWIWGGNFKRTTLYPCFSR